MSMDNMAACSITECFTWIYAGAPNSSAQVKIPKVVVRLRFACEMQDYMDGTPQQEDSAALCSPDQGWM